VAVARRGGKGAATTLRDNSEIGGGTQNEAQGVHGKKGAKSVPLSGVEKGQQTRLLGTLGNAHATMTNEGRAGRKGFIPIPDYKSSRKKERG